MRHVLVEEQSLSREQKTKEIENLTHRISELREQRDKIEAEARVHADKRDKLNGQNRGLHAEIIELRSERDKLNEEVKNLKLVRSELKETIREKIEEIQKLTEQSKELAEKRPSKSHQSLQKEVDSIEWKIQTMPLSLQEERELVERVKHLWTQLNIYRKLEKMKREVHELQTEIKATKTKEEQFHGKLTETARRSQEVHQEMLGKIEESRKLKAEADSQHQLFLQARESAKPVEIEIAQLSNRLRQSKLKKQTEEELEKKTSEEALREKLASGAREKLKRGEKLSWEEFRLLDYDEGATQD
jgi:uncharacterized coiled-coil DUF342 family protein